MTDLDEADLAAAFLGEFAREVDQMIVSAPSVAPEPNTAADCNALQCGSRPCEVKIQSRRKHAAFCSDACRVHVFRHPEDDARVERKCWVKRGKKRDPQQEAQKAQTQKVLSMLQIGPCTTETFLRAYIGRFGARIAELRAVGWKIKMIKTGEHSARYVLMGRDK